MNNNKSTEIIPKVKVKKERIQRRVFGIVYDQTTLTGAQIISLLQKNKWGVYQAFSYRHYKDYWGFWSGLWLGCW